MNRALLAIPALLALGCASAPNIQTNRDPLVPLPKGATWAWGSRDTAVSQYEHDPAAQNPILHQRVKTAIERSLEKKGFKQVAAPDDAVLVVTYHIGMKRTTQMETSTIATGGGGYYGGWYGGYGWGYYGAPTYVTNTEMVDYKQGGVLVYIRDRATGKVAWAGLYTKDVHDTDQVTAESVQRGADELFRDLK